MFQEWGFLLTEIWVLLALAALLGLVVGWIIWGRQNDHSQVDKIQAKLDTCRAELNAKNTEAPSSKDTDTAKATPVISPISEPKVGEDYDGDGVFEGTNEGIRPEGISSPRNGVADDLKQIKGIGLKMEKICNELGFYHFDQIAIWTSQEIAWVDANLEGFKGRVTRDAWISQAKILASGGSTAFAKKVSDGDVEY
jgi:predicted flap endonuclease-1-like 5' DNA nuclease